MSLGVEAAEAAAERVERDRTITAARERQARERLTAARKEAAATQWEARRLSAALADAAADRTDLSSRLSAAQVLRDHTAHTVSSGQDCRLSSCCCFSMHVCMGWWATVDSHHGVLSKSAPRTQGAVHELHRSVRRLDRRNAELAAALAARHAASKDSDSGGEDQKAEQQLAAAAALNADVQAQLQIHRGVTQLAIAVAVDRITPGGSDTADCG